MKNTIKEKNYSHNQIAKKFYQLTQVQQINILYKALDYMQSYNGRNRFLCIAMAMGYENYEGGVDTYTKR